MGTRNGASAFWAKDAKDTGDWKQAHAALSRLARERAALDAEEGRWLLRALRSAAHVHLGFGSFAEYIERLFGHRPRTTRESCASPRRSRGCHASGRRSRRAP